MTIIGWIAILAAVANILGSAYGIRQGRRARRTVTARVEAELRDFFAASTAKGEASVAFAPVTAGHSPRDLEEAMRFGVAATQKYLDDLVAERAVPGGKRDG